MSKLPETAEDVVRTMSHSKTEMWNRCQFQFFMRYVMGEKRPPSSMLALGRATDTMADVVHRFKLTNGFDLPEEEAVEIWDAEWKAEAKEVDGWKTPTEKADLTDKAPQTIRRWHEKIATQIVPVHVKVWFELILEHTWTLNGEVDLVHRPIAEQHRLPIPSDTKMTSKRWNAKQAFSTLQPAIYALALEHAPDIEANVSLFQFHVGVLYSVNKRASSDPAQIITRRVTENEKEGALARIGAARRQIMHAFESGDFLPNRQGQMCSRRHCGYWEECEKRFGPRVPD